MAESSLGARPEHAGDVNVWDGKSTDLDPSQILIYFPLVIHTNEIYLKLGV